jgi:DNA-binding transcriptional ArsR family regulator
MYAAMDTDRGTARALAALGHETRLTVFRLLVKAGGDGLNVGEIARHTGLPSSTLAHHLGTLVDAGLVIQSRHGREVISRADYAAMQRIVDFLAAECCTGVATATQTATEDAL